MIQVCNDEGISVERRKVNAELVLMNVLFCMFSLDKQLKQRMQLNKHDFYTLHIFVTLFMYIFVRRPTFSQYWFFYIFFYFINRFEINNNWRTFINFFFFSQANILLPKWTEMLQQHRNCKHALELPSIYYSLLVTYTQFSWLICQDFYNVTLLKGQAS